MHHAKAVKKQLPKQLVLLESLRGVAALLIVAFHATGLFNLKFKESFLLSIFRFGDSGVDFFFVLSGFFLAISSAQYIGDASKAKSFLLKRFIRIYPFYWLINAMIIPIYFLVPSFGKGHETNIDSIIKSLLLVPQEPLPILAVAWFLSHIVFFYIIFALVILQPKVFSALTVGLLFLSTIFIVSDLSNSLYEDKSINPFVNFLFSYHNLEFVAGYLIATLCKTHNLKRKTSLILLSIGSTIFLLGGLAEVFLSHSFSLSTSFYHYYEFIIYGLSSILIIAGAAFLESVSQIRSNKYLLMLGAASFSIYLVHYPVLSILTKIIQLVNIENLIFLSFCMALACIIAVLSGCIIHFHIEKSLALLLRKHLIK